MSESVFILPSHVIWLDTKFLITFFFQNDVATILIGSDFEHYRNKVYQKYDFFSILGNLYVCFFFLIHNCRNVFLSLKF